MSHDSEFYSASRLNDVIGILTSIKITDLQIAKKIANTNQYTISNINF